MIHRKPARYEDAQSRLRSRIEIRQEPYVANYPPLQAWLESHESHCQWQQRVGPNLMVEGWMVDGVCLLIQVYGAGSGWGIFTQCPSNAINRVVADANDRIQASRGPKVPR